MLSATRGVLRTLAAAAPAIAQAPQAECHQLLTSIGTPLPMLHALLVTSLEGRVICSTRAEILGLDVSDRNYFREAVARKAPAESDFLIGRATAKPVILAAHPLLSANGDVTGVLLGVLRVDWLDSLIAERASPNDRVAFILNASGTLIARQPEHTEWLGRNVSEYDVTKRLMQGERTFTANGLDGVRRIFASVKLNERNSLLVVGLRESDVLSNINQQVYIAYGSLAVVTLIVLLAAWLGGQRFVVQPIKSLAEMASSVGRGDYAAGEMPVRGPEEFRPLQIAIRSMAARLSARETALRTANVRLGRLAQQDALTGLANRGSFDAQLVAEHQHARQSGEPLAVILIDVDHFKAFNDQYGHVAGDACLREVAGAIEKMVRGSDFAARYGGEEFVVLGRGMNAEAAIAAAERMRAAVRALGVPHERSPHRCVTISIGVASTVPTDDQLPERLVEEADVALYAAKKQGRDRVASSSDVFALAG